LDGEWFQYGRKQGINSAEKEKLIAPEISKGGNFSYDFKGEFYSTTTIYGYIKNKDVKESYKSLLAILNSNLLWWFLVNTGTTLANGYFRFKPNYIKDFPMPIVSKETENTLIDIVDKILNHRNIHNLSGSIELENEINNIVYSLYDLRKEEIEVIEKCRLS